VAYKLAEELHISSPSKICFPDYLLDLTAMGLVADLAVLRGDTRYLVQKGLTVLRNTRRLGLQVMMEMAELSPSNLSEEHIGFVLGPRLNALGRLGDSNPVVELLTTSDPARARLLATQLENYNAQRQLLCRQVTQAAEARLRAEPALLENPVLVLGHPSWPAGVVGIVASRMVERYRKPAILLSTPEGEPARGSARSVDGLNITAAIAAQKDLLFNFGGHPMAAGLSLDVENLPEFSRRLSRTVAQMLGETTVKEATLEISAWLNLSQINPDLAAALEYLAPFGPGNPQPVLAVHDLTMQSATVIGRNQEHLKLTMTDETGCSQTLVWWNGAGETLPEGKFDMACTARASNWRGSRQLQLELIDFRTVEAQPAEIKTQLEIVDCRNTAEPHNLIPNFQEQTSTLVWVEGNAKKDVGGKDRNELHPAEHLIIWNAPPSPEELHNALASVRPRRVTLVGIHPPFETTGMFLTRLAGLVKFALSHRSGEVTLSGLAAATAQRQLTVEKGLKWLVLNGVISLTSQEGDRLVVASGKSANSPIEAERLREEIQALLVETAAYRAHFQHADKNTLLPQ
jgi:single-stranded-DNA-specific exonuclease